MLGGLAVAVAMWPLACLPWGKHSSHVIRPEGRLFQLARRRALLNPFRSIFSPVSTAALFLLLIIYLPL